MPSVRCPPRLPQPVGDRKKSTSVLLRAIVLLGEAASHDGDITAGEYSTKAKENSCSTPSGAREAKRNICSVAGDQALRLLAAHDRLFWRKLEKRMRQLVGAEESNDTSVNHEEGADGGGGRRAESDALIASPGSVILGDLGEDADAATATKVKGEGTLLELVGLLDVFRLLAARSLISPQNEAVLEGLVFPAVLSKRR